MSNTLHRKVRLRAVQKGLFLLSVHPAQRAATAVKGAPLLRGEASLDGADRTRTIGVQEKAAGWEFQLGPVRK
jgi:hypothetical protein